MGWVDVHNRAPIGVNEMVAVYVPQREVGEAVLSNGIYLNGCGRKTLCTQL